MGRGGVRGRRIDRVLRAVRQHFADPTFYARRFRARRLDAPVPCSPRRPERLGSKLGLRTLLRFRPEWIRAREGPPPSAFDRWMAHPAVFVPCILTGCAAVAATFDTPRTAPTLRVLIPAGSAVIAWMGLLGATSSAELRWPRAGSIVRYLWVVAGLAAVVASFVLWRRAVSLSLAQIGIWTIVAVVLPGLRRRSAGDEG